jgi:hypothetical protein
MLTLLFDVRITEVEVDLLLFLNLYANNELTPNVSRIIENEIVF